MNARPRPDGDCAQRLGRGLGREPSAAFAVLLTCIDGRIQTPLAQWVRQRYEVAYADVITEPGIDAVLAHGPEEARAALLDKICISRLAHHAAHAVIAGHHDCAANPVARAVHEEQIRAAVDYLRATLPRLTTVGVYVDNTWTPRLVRTPSTAPA